MRRTTKKGSAVDMELFGGVAVGGATGGFIGQQLQKLEFISANPGSASTIIGLIKGGAGYLMLTRMKSPFVQGIGLGWIADGASDLGSAMGITGLRAQRLGTGYYAEHNRKHGILGPATDPAYRQLGANTEPAANGRAPLMAKVI